MDLSCWVGSLTGSPEQAAVLPSHRTPPGSSMACENYICTNPGQSEQYHVTYLKTFQLLHKNRFYWITELSHKLYTVNSWTLFSSSCFSQYSFIFQCFSLLLLEDVKMSTVFGPLFERQVKNVFDHCCGGCFTFLTELLNVPLPPEI